MPRNKLRRLAAVVEIALESLSFDLNRFGIPARLKI
jgi:hypothetical protein